MSKHLIPDIQIISFNYNCHIRTFSNFGCDHNPMPKLFGNLPAQIKSDSRRSFICPSVIPGITFFKNPWQILLPDADSLIRDHKLTGIVGFIPVYMYCNRVIFAAVLNRIGQNLLHNKFQPLFIREHHLPAFLIVNGNLLRIIIGANLRIAVRTT